MADYRKKYLKYKKKYLELKTQLGGAPIFPWLPIKSKQLHIQAVIDPDSILGKGLTERFTKLDKKFHVSLLEILIPSDLKNYGKQTNNDNPIHKYLLENIETFAKYVLEIYNKTFADSLAHSKSNYDQYGRFFVIKYDNPLYIDFFSDKFEQFKKDIITKLSIESSIKDGLITKIHTSSSDPKKPPVITRNFTHFYQKFIYPDESSLPLQLPLKLNENTSLFAISEYFNKPVKAGEQGIGWKPHISVSVTALADKNDLEKSKEVVGEEVREVEENTLNYLLFWSSKISKIIPNQPEKSMFGSISKLIIKYGDLPEQEVDL